MSLVWVIPDIDNECEHSDEYGDNAYKQRNIDILYINLATNNASNVQESNHC